MTKWFNVGGYSFVSCCKCSYKLENLLDHHSINCPGCNVKCIVIPLSLKSSVQILLEQAPESISKWISWSHKNLDELEFVELITNISEMFEVSEN